ncbi:hypothetical protein EST38_g11330 [Candolleomyces aberdarensis]|uniref:Uncharacterized protein n=1 Tax=Candolleomyces aberdarensis TaxID=2316362 RepID=A0A4V1Q2B7_9AGAR|nr:hypothetical protein EST38_g11330 [Candolleomyces aberdarensis]
MMLLQTLTAFLTLLIAVAGAPPTLRAINRYDGETTGRHIVILKPGLVKASLIEQISQRHTAEPLG